MQRCLAKYIKKLYTVDKGVKGFQRADIYPFQPTAFNEEDFAPANRLLNVSVNVATSNGTETKKSIDEQENVATSCTSTALSRELQNNTTARNNNIEFIS